MVHTANSEQYDQHIIQIKPTFSCAVICRIIVMLRALRTFGLFIMKKPLSSTCDTKTSSSASTNGEDDDACSSSSGSQIVTATAVNGSAKMQQRRKFCYMVLLSVTSDIL